MSHIDPELLLTCRDAPEVTQGRRWFEPRSGPAALIATVDVDEVDPDRLTIGQGGDHGA